MVLDFEEDGVVGDDVERVDRLHVDVPHPAEHDGNKWPTENEDDDAIYNFMLTNKEILIIKITKQFCNFHSIQN